MKAILLSGESGSKLHPLTNGVPKQLLPIYDKPMVYYPIKLLVEVGITEILIITSENQLRLFQEALGNGERFNAHFSYKTQSHPNGIAEAITIGRDFIGDAPVCLITGDTIIVGNGMQEQIKKAEKAVKISGSATIFVTHDNDDNQYGKVIMNSKGKLEGIVGDSNSHNFFSIVGLYVFPSSVVKFAEKITVSERGLLEITDVNKKFFENSKIQILTLPQCCTWLDTNSPDTLLAASKFVKNFHQNNKLHNDHTRL